MINIGIGIGWAKALYFKARVLSYPNSIFEAGPCLDATLEELNAIGLLDNASLIITPNAYNEGILYDVVPNTTLGDMNVVRATTATRVNSAGLIEVVPRNLLQRSEEFENAVWLAGGSGAFVVTTNSTTAPNGTLTADKLIAPLTNQTIRQNLANINTAYTLSVYLKTNSGTKQMRLFINDTQIESIVNVTSDWQRFTLSGTTGGTLFGSGRVGIANVDILNESSFVYIWGAQFENFATATEYFPTTTRLNVPRLDYTNSSCPSILVEPQRTNVYLNSDNFSVSDGISGCAITSNVEISPDGNMNADKIQGDGSITTFQVFNNITIAASTIYTFSVFAKAGNTNFVQLTCNLMDIATDAVFDVSLGTITSTGTNSNPTITDYGNGWYRCSINMVAQTTDLSGRFRIYVPADGSGAAWVGSASNGKNIFLYGRQLEAGSNATSYIPTVAATVTRNADVISKTGISSLIGQTQGTIVLDFELQSNNINGNYLFSLSDGTTSNLIRSEIYILSPTVSQFRTGLTTSGVGQGDNFTTITQLRNKMAISYSLNNFKLFINGVLVYTDTTATIPATSGFYLGNRIGVGNIIGANYKQAILFKTQLTDQE